MGSKFDINFRPLVRVRTTGKEEGRRRMGRKVCGWRGVPSFPEQGNEGKREERDASQKTLPLFLTTIFRNMGMERGSHQTEEGGRFGDSERASIF